MPDQPAVMKELGELEELRNLIGEYLDKYLLELEYPQSKALAQLMESIRYSLLGGGKRFRPILSLAFSEAFGINPLRILPWAAAIEMVHTYSLIHDDLPSMDNDDFRRGKPTNHKVHGEPLALLAGDGLLTEAFGLIAKKYEKEPTLVAQLIRLLSRSAGLCGMVGGQAMDLAAQSHQSQGLGVEELKITHELKTGALIRASVEGAAIICDLPESKNNITKKFGSQLGLAFQLADDLLDYNPKNLEKGNFATLLGFEETKKWLSEVTLTAQQCLDELNFSSKNSNLLLFLVKYNKTRIH